jgi:hypothetical protein
VTNDQTLYAFDLCDAHHLPGGRVLVRNPRNGRQAVLTPDVYGALLGCRRFHTLADHARRLTALNPALAGQEAEVLDVLRSVQADGLMLAADIYPVTLKPASPPKYHVDKPVVAVLTWERPEALDRCLASLAERVNAETVARFVIIDDSRSETARSANRARTEAFAESAGAPVLYLGAEEQRGFMEAIIRQIPALESQVRFLLDRERWAEHWTSGLARTVSLLISVGQRLVVFDDDVVCEVYEPEHAGGVGFAENEREARFYGDRSDWQEERAEAGLDPVLRHLRVLGSSLDDALAALGVPDLSPQDFSGADLETLERLRPDSRVLVSECGSMGDAGTANLNWIAALEGSSLERLLSDPDTVEHALTTRNCWVGQRRHHFLPRAYMSQCTGLDNRSLLPPYTPVLRGEDQLFGSMVHFIHPHAVVADQAWAVAHLPVPERRWSEEEQRFDTSQPFQNFALAAMSGDRGHSRAREPLKRLGHLARVFDDLSDTDTAELRRDYARSQVEARATDFRDLTQALEAAGDAPERWQRFLEEALERLNLELVENPEDGPIRGYPPGQEGDALLAWWQGYWRDFGQALRAWPAIRQAAKNVQI